MMQSGLGIKEESRKGLILYEQRLVKAVCELPPSIQGVPCWFPNPALAGCSLVSAVLILASMEKNVWINYSSVNALPHIN